VIVGIAAHVFVGGDDPGRDLYRLAGKVRPWRRKDLTCLRESLALGGPYPRERHGQQRRE